jgi:hypothetical protein
MFIGHFAVALAAKKLSPKTSLGTLVLGAQFADFLWPVLLLTGLEQVRIAPGTTRVTPLDFVSYPISHSLVTQLGWGALLALVYYALRRSLRGAWVVGACVPTHWVLDWIVHRPDMPLWPGGPRVGLGLWDSLPVTITVEYGLLIAGVAIYLSATRPRKSGDRVGAVVFWSFVALLAAGWLINIGPPPPSVSALAWGGLVMWLTIPWAAWADRHRMPRGEILP